MKSLFAAIACTLVVAVAASTAGANLIVGVNDDTVTEVSMPTFFMQTMQSEGLQTDALTLRWDETQPTTLNPALVTDIQQVLGAAESAGITVELDLYPLHSQALTDGRSCRPLPSPTACGDTARIREFASWAAMVAQTFPTVHEFVVMNECNQPLFINPQWNKARLNQSAEICGRALAATYDALKQVSSSNFVWGVGLSPRGNDAPTAPTNSSTSPVRFLQDLGAWFNAFAAKTNRRAPLMDGFDFHPYPVPQSLPFSTGYANPRDATVANLSRIYQAFYDGFSGSPQPTIGQQKGGGLPVSLNEMGIQTAATGMPGYQGVEISATPTGGVIGKYATQAYQASYYLRTLWLLACDPNVRLVNLFHLIDEPELAGWQSGLYWYSPTAPTPKESAVVVASWITQSGGKCQGKMLSWRPAPLATRRR